MSIARKFALKRLALVDLQSSIPSTGLIVRGSTGRPVLLQAVDVHAFPRRNSPSRADLDGDAVVGAAGGAAPSVVGGVLAPLGEDAELEIGGSGAVTTVRCADRAESATASYPRHPKKT